MTENGGCYSILLEFEERTMKKTKPPRKKDPVRFAITLKKGKDTEQIANQVRAELLKLSPNIQVWVHVLKNLKMVVMIGETNQKTYEKVFGAKLAYVSETVPNLNRGARDVWIWRETKSATIPASIAEYVEQIQLDVLVFLTD